MKVLVRGFGTFALFDDISGIAKDLEKGESSGAGDQNYSPFARTSAMPVPNRHNTSLEIGRQRLLEMYQKKGLVFYCQ